MTQVYSQEVEEIIFKWFLQKQKSNCFILNFSGYYNEQHFYETAKSILIIYNTKTTCFFYMVFLW